MIRCNENPGLTNQHRQGFHLALDMSDEPVRGKGIPIGHTTFSWISPSHKPGVGHTDFSWMGISSRELRMMMMDDCDDADDWQLVDDELTASVGRVVEESVAGVRRSDDPRLFAALAATTFVAGCAGARAPRQPAPPIASPPPAVDASTRAPGLKSGSGADTEAGCR